jgi:FdhD protein
MTTKKQSIRSTTYVIQKGDSTEFVDGAVIEEVLACIFVNGQELAKFMCSTHDLDELALGFLRSEGIIQRRADVELLTISASNCVDIWLKDSAFKLPGRPIITSGCGGGVTFDDLSQRQPALNTNTTLKPEQVFGLMKQLHLAAALYNEVRGVHTSALSDGKDLLLVAQDVGRHNTIDRLWGQALKQGIATEGRILLASGRISSEMLNKAAKMGVPIIISRTSPTSLSVDLGRAWHITVIGYARGNNFRIYTAPERVVSGERLPMAVAGHTP